MGEGGATGLSDAPLVAVLVNEASVVFSIVRVCDCSLVSLLLGIAARFGVCGRTRPPWLSLGWLVLLRDRPGRSSLDHYQLPCGVYTRLSYLCR